MRFLRTFFSILNFILNIIFLTSPLRKSKTRVIQRFTILTIIKVVKQIRRNLIDFRIEAIIPFAKCVHNESYIVSYCSIKPIFYLILSSMFSEPIYRFNSFCMKHHRVPCLSCKPYNIQSSFSDHSYLFRLGSRKFIHFYRHYNQLLLNPFQVIQREIIFHFFDEYLGQSQANSFFYFIRANIPAKSIIVFLLFFAFTSIQLQRLNSYFLNPKQESQDFTTLLSYFAKFVGWVYVALKDKPSSLLSMLTSDKVLLTYTNKSTASMGMHLPMK